jgi:hypothetical protein
VSRSQRRRRGLGQKNPNSGCTYWDMGAPLLTSVGPDPQYTLRRPLNARVVKRFRTLPERIAAKHDELPQEDTWRARQWLRPSARR